MRCHLKAIREAKGIVIYDLVGKAKVSPNLICAIEKYGYCPGLEPRLKLAKALSVRETDIWPDLYAAEGNSPLYEHEITMARADIC
jgi:ribosome-binding protein aMBF1 (putative translation factor)